MMTMTCPYILRDCVVVVAAAAAVVDDNDDSTQ
jgi:hypothetical protein